MSDVPDQCPIQLEPLKPYFGDDPKKARAFEKDLQTAENIAKYINCKMGSADDRPVMIIYGEIADALHLDETKVRNYLLQLRSSTGSSVLSQRPPNILDGLELAEVGESR
jgi:hypothetical protein